MGWWWETEEGCWPTRGAIVITQSPSTFFSLPFLCAPRSAPANSRSLPLLLHPPTSTNSVCMWWGVRETSQPASPSPPVPLGVNKVTSSSARFAQFLLFFFASNRCVALCVEVVRILCVAIFLRNTCSFLLEGLLCRAVLCRCSPHNSHRGVVKVCHQTAQSSTSSSSSLLQIDFLPKKAQPECDHRLAHSRRRL